MSTVVGASAYYKGIVRDINAYRKAEYTRILSTKNARYFCL